jgi:hypothetical protein
LSPSPTFPSLTPFFLPNKRNKSRRIISNKINNFYVFHPATLSFFETIQLEAVAPNCHNWALLCQLEPTRVLS